MPVSLSIKAVPDDVAAALRKRAQRNHRSLQGELLDILESAVRATPFQSQALLRRLERLQLSTPAESLRMVRDDRRR
jgi:plasmid stability protein